MSRIVVAMSGGVDSSIAACLLQREGWEVVGITLDLRGPGGGACRPSIEAQQVCRLLGIEHHTLDCSEEFKRTIVEPFCDEYFRGRTPNPCVRCNPLIKFRRLVAAAREFGADAMATGHYVRLEPADQLSIADSQLPIDMTRCLLLKARDGLKDQSYVLFALQQEQLSRCRFPLGEWKKPKVRALAQELGFSNHERPDSQEICFVPDDDYGAFLAGIAPERIRPGRIVDTSGRFLGRHRGIHRFTLGQRRRLGIAVGEPRYVVRLEPETATVVVGSKEETCNSAFTVRDVNWIAFAHPPSMIEARVKIRYTHQPAPARIETIPAEQAARVTFASPESAITPGQAAVFYHHDLLLGGGTIDKLVD